MSREWRPAGRTGRYANPEPALEWLIIGLMDPTARAARRQAATIADKRGIDRLRP
jgi:hypothetical protein